MWTSCSFRYKLSSLSSHLLFLCMAFKHKVIMQHFHTESQEENKGSFGSCLATVFSFSALNTKTFLCTTLHYDSTSSIWNLQYFIQTACPSVQLINPPTKSLVNRNLLIYLKKISISKGEFIIWKNKQTNKQKPTVDYWSILGLRRCMWNLS